MCLMGPHGLAFGRVGPCSGRARSSKPRCDFNPTILGFTHSPGAAHHQRAGAKGDSQRLPDHQARDSRHRVGPPRLAASRTPATPTKGIPARRATRLPFASSISKSLACRCRQSVMASASPASTSRRRSAMGASSASAATRNQPTESASPIRMAPGRSESTCASRWTAGGITPAPNRRGSNCSLSTRAKAISGPVSAAIGRASTKAGLVPLVTDEVSSISLTRPRATRPRFPMAGSPPPPRLPGRAIP